MDLLNKASSIRWGDGTSRAANITLSSSIICLSMAYCFIDQAGDGVNRKAKQAGTNQCTVIPPFLSLWRAYTKVVQLVLMLTAREVRERDACSLGGLWLQVCGAPTSQLLHCALDCAKSYVLP